MEILCIIPARGGSKRIKNKNTCLLGAHPLIEWTIRQAQQTELINRIIVSTDSESIKFVALASEVEVHDRKPEMATNTAGLEPVVIDILDELRADDYIPDYVVLLQPTTPFRNPEDIDAGINRIIDLRYDSLLFCTKFERFVWDTDMNPLNYDYKTRQRTQDMPTYLLENGNYITRPEIYRKHKNRLGGKMTYYVMDRMSEFEIDTEFDLAVCRGLQQELGLEIP